MKKQLCQRSAMVQLQSRRLKRTAAKGTEWCRFRKDENWRRPRGQHASCSDAHVASENAPLAVQIVRLLFDSPLKQNCGDSAQEKRARTRTTEKEIQLPQVACSCHVLNQQRGENKPSCQLL